MKILAPLFALLISPLVAETQFANVYDDESGDFFPYASKRLNDIEGYITRPENLVFSKYGGWKAAGQREATGFFRVENIDGRWWAIDPEGYLYFHKAVNSAQLNADISADDIYELLPTFGLNGSGSFSDEEVLESDLRESTPIAHCPRINFARSYSFTRSDRLAIAVFDDEFPAHCAQQAEDFRPFRDDPQVFGYFTDNELSWTFSGGLESHLDVNDPNDKNYARAIEFLRARVGDTGSNNFTEADEDEYAAIMAERYFSVVTAAIRAVDPNHMILGPRLNRSWVRSQSFHEAAGRYLDIVALNHYHRWGTRDNELQNIATWTGRPLMLSEFYAMEKIPGVEEDGAGWRVETQKDRVLFNEHFTTTQIARPFIVGMHWFNFQDDAPNPNDPINEPGAIRGIIDINGNPHEELQASMKYMNDRIYDYIQFIDGQNTPDLSIVAEADAYFRGSDNLGLTEEAQPVANPELIVRQGGTRVIRNAYLRFAVPELTRPVKSAKIKLFSISPDEKLTGTFYADFVADDSWSETSINRTNAPTTSTRLLEFHHGDDLEIDVTEQVIAAAAGDNELSIALTPNPADTFRIELQYASSEHPNINARPTLVITYNDAPENTQTYSQWLSTFANLTETGFLDDGDNDGEELVLEYIFDNNPTTPDVIRPLSTNVSGASTTITFSRNAASIFETQQILQYSTDLINWTDVPTNTDTAANVTFSNTTNSIQEVSVEVDTNSLAPETKLFYRVKVQDLR